MLSQSAISVIGIVSHRELSNVCTIISFTIIPFYINLHLNYYYLIWILFCSYEILYAVLNLDSILFYEIFHAILYHEVVVNDGSHYLILLCSCIYTRRGCVIGG